MGKISVGSAAGAGLGVIGRHPVAVVFWGVALLVLSLLPTFALFGVMGPDMAEMFRAMTTHKGGEPNPAAFEQFMQMQSGMMLFQIGSWLWSGLVNAVICSAIFRAVLHPAQSGFAYLRLGAAELWLALLFLVETVLLYIVAVIATLAVAALMMIGYVVGNKAGGDVELPFKLLCVGAVLAIVFSLIWVCLRLSMAAPMTFADRQFRLFESWTLTRGKGWSLLGVGVLTVLLIIVIELIVAGLVLVALRAMGGPPAWLQDMADIEAFLSRPPADLLRLIGPWVAVGSVIWMLLASVLFTVFCAPWAAAYKALTREA